MTVFRKSLLTLGLAALGFAAVLNVSFLALLNTLYYEINAASLKNTATSLMTAIGKGRIADIFAANAINSSIKIESPVKVDLPLNAESAYRLTLVDTEGDVLWDSHLTDGLVNHIDREEITAALEGREAGARRNSVSTQIKRLYYALPVFDDGGNPVGVFRLSLAVPGFGMRISSIVFPFVFFSCMLAVLVFAAIFAYSRSLSSSIGRLVKIAQAGAPLLSGPDAMENIAPEFRSLEKALRAMTWELNLRFEQAKNEGNRLEAILNGMSEAVFAMDSSLKLLLVNPKARSIFNLLDRDIKTMTLLEATRSTELVETANKALSDGSPLEKELTFRTGAQQCFQVYVSPLAGNDSTGVVLVLQEITRLVKLERIRKDFVANVSHELRTPIQLIKGFSETLLDTVSEERDGGKKNIIHFIEIIQKNAGIMENLTNDLLILADLENNAVNAREMEELSVSPLIDEAVSSVEPQAKRKQIEIIVKCNKELKAKLYGSFFIQALINLIDNGIKYSPPKSKLWLSASTFLNLENEELLLEVKDKGIGIPGEHIERIFERFYRVDRARSREAGGTGLGLSIVRHIAIMHKGRVEAESHAGEGSVFRIIIPLGEVNSKKYS